MGWIVQSIFIISIDAKDIIMNDVISVGKVAQQSSVSIWSSSQDTGIDAGLAVNGKAAEARFFHTDIEDAPWWQVDLGAEFVVTEVRIFNRMDAAGRLGWFSVLISLSGEEDSWVPIKFNHDIAFNVGNVSPVGLRPEQPMIGRFVRIQKTERGFLHLCQCQVLGYTPDAVERDRLIADEILNRQEFSGYQSAIDSLRQGREGYFSYIGKHLVFVDTGSYSKLLVDVLTSGGYEARERNIIVAAMQPTDRVLEVGTAIGAVTMTAASIVTPAQIVTYDANPAMITDAKRNFAANHMAGIQACVGVMRNRRNWIEGETEVDFFVSRDFWASSLFVGGFNTDIIAKISVPLRCLEDEIQRHRANVLVCDIEGGEAALLLGADLANIRMIILETHYHAVGREKIDGMVRYLIAEGFNINLDYSGGHILLLDRELSAA